MNRRQLILSGSAFGVYALAPVKSKKFKDLSMTYPTPLRGFYFRMQTISEITLGVSTTATLPSQNVVKPGKYLVYGTGVDMTTEGLYVISDFAGRCTCVISYRSDINALLSGICYLITQGDSDNSLTVAQLQSTVMTRKAIITCGVSAKLAQAILAQANVQCRLNGGLAGGSYNGYDDGHLTIEIFINNGWYYIDIDNNYSVWMGSIGSTRATLLDIHSNLTTGQLVFEPLTTGAWCDVGGFSNKAIPFLVGGLRNNAASLLAWYGRMFQVAYQINGVANYFYNDNATYAAAAEGYSASFSPMSTSMFQSTYYPALPPAGVHEFSVPDTTTGFSSTLYTWFDSGHFIPNGSVVASVGFDFVNSVTGLVALIGQQNSDGTISIVASGSSGNHLGGGWADFALSSSYTVPPTGTYFVGFSAAVNTNSFVSVGQRARYTGAMSGNNNAVTYYSDGTLAVRWISA